MNDLEHDETDAGCQNSGVSDTDAPSTPPKRGAQPGNTNKVTTGHRAGCPGVVLTTLGRRYAAAYFDLGKMRRQMRALAVQRFGALTLSCDLQIQTICRHEASCRLAEQMLRENPKMPPTEVVRLRDSISKWASVRDAAFVRLFGDVTQAVVSGDDPFSELDQEASAALKWYPDQAEGVDQDEL